MKLRLENAMIIATGPEKQFLPTAEEIYKTLFEGKNLLRGQPVTPDEFQSLGVQFSDVPATPAILIAADTSANSEPAIRCALGGKVGPSAAPASLDSVIIDNTWYPLPQNTVA